MRNIKQINIKNRTYCVFNNMIHIKNFDSSLLKIDKTSYKNIEIYYIGYIKMKDLDYINNHGVNRLYYLSINQMNTLKKAMEIDIQV